MSDDWNTYRTRSLIRAKRLTEYVSFTDPLGRTHSGDPGDYLVQAPDGQLRVTPQQVFEDVFVTSSLKRFVEKKALTRNSSS